MDGFGVLDRQAVDWQGCEGVLVVRRQQAVLGGVVVHGPTSRQDELHPLVAQGPGFGVDMAVRVDTDGSQVPGEVLGGQLVGVSDADLLGVAQQVLDGRAVPSTRGHRRAEHILVVLQPPASQFPRGDRLKGEHRRHGGGQLGVHLCARNSGVFEVISDPLTDWLAVLSKVNPPRAVVLID